MAKLEADTGVAWWYSEGTLFSQDEPKVVLFPNAGDDPQQAAESFLARYGAIFGIVDSSAELVLRYASRADSYLLAGARFDQREQGVDVYHGSVSVLFNARGRILGSSSFVSGLSCTSAVPALTPDAAVVAAESATHEANPATRNLQPDGPVAPELLFFPTSAQAATLSYRVDLSYSAPGLVATRYFIDADTGAVVASVDLVSTSGP